uniref:hypothetical protein n=1 Tax=Candidatus Nitrotoga sp. HW29 TaxID=2886963 RepID=UPI001EF1DDFA|nr:hypothetical protein [Candidatus Nitrotoga sp. HW29]
MRAKTQQNAELEQAVEGFAQAVGQTRSIFRFRTSFLPLHYPNSYPSAHAADEAMLHQ